MPGLINTHGHAPMVMYRGLADDLALMDWLQQYIFPAEAKTVAPAFVRAGTELAALEMIRSGTTTYVDMYYFEEEIARVTRAAGLRGVLGETVIGFPSPDAKTPADALSRTERFLQEFADDPLITPAVAPHSMYLVDKAVLLACRALAMKHQKPLLIHLAETEDEIKTARERFQASPTAYLEQIGFWAPRTLAAHGVWVTDEDIALLAQAHVGVSHNPESNMKLASGTAPVTKYLKAGVAVGLGTDGAASNNDLDMFDAMRADGIPPQAGDARPAGAARSHRARARDSGRRARPRDGPPGRLTRAREARRPPDRRYEQRPPDTALRSRVPPGLRHAWRRCGDDDRAREGADGRQDGVDARRAESAGRGAADLGGSAAGGGTTMKEG